MKKSPISTSSTPETSRSVSRFSPRLSPRPVAVIPSATNIAVNERQKMIAGSRTFRRDLPASISANSSPDIAER
jgi:hypothetical protein